MMEHIRIPTFNLELYDLNNTAHIDVLNELWTDNDTNKYLYDKDKFINNILNGDDKYNSIYIVSIDSTYIGFVSLYFYDNTYEVSNGILKDFRGRGYSTKLIKEFCEYVFDNTNINKLYAYIDEKNISSIKSAIKVGFSNTNGKEYLLTRDNI